MVTVVGANWISGTVYKPSFTSSTSNIVQRDRSRSLTISSNPNSSGTWVCDGACTTSSIKFIKQLALMAGAAKYHTMKTWRLTNVYHTTNGTFGYTCMCTREFNDKYNINDSHLFQRIPTVCKQHWHQQFPNYHHTQYPTDDCCISQLFLQMEKSH